MEPKNPTVPGVADVQQLTRQGSTEIVLGPETEVLCLHRGRRQTENGAPVVHPAASRNRQGWVEDYHAGDYKDTYDGHHYVIKPGYFKAPYGAALHFQKRAVVPGTRNPEAQGQQSFISIIGVVQGHPDGTFEVLKAVDDMQDWKPFTDEDCDRYEIAFEAIDRSSMVNPIDKDVMLAGVRPAPPTRQGGAPNIQTTDETILEPVPAEENLALQEAREGRAAGAGQPDAGEAGQGQSRSGRRR